MQVTLRIRRFNPEQDQRPHMESYVVDAEPTDQVLDLLNRVKDYQDGSLTYRRSCGHGVCGSDAMRINGRNRLACKELVKNLGDHITVEPLMGMPVVKDLVVDLKPFFDHYKTVMPYLVNDEPPPARERLQTLKAAAPQLDTGRSP